MTRRLHGKVAIITGGASGIGEAAARLFVEEGACVVIADRDVERGNRLAGEFPASAIFVETDVSKDADVRRLIGRAVERFGTLDVMFNNAGIIVDGHDVTTFEEADFDRILAVNVKGVFLGMKHAIPVMLAKGGGSVISTSSTAGLAGYAGQCAYGASKGAVIQLTRHVSTEVAAKGVRVNCICAGGVLSQLVLSRRPGVPYEDVASMFASTNPMQRAGLPIDIANAALWLASDESSFVTGQAITVDGGRTASIYRGPTPKGLGPHTGIQAD